MSQLIAKRHNTYRRHDGAVLGWERGTVGQGHSVQVIEDDGAITPFNWRSPKDPTAGDQVTIVLPAEGVSAKQDRPIIILNHTTGDTHREVNAHDPKGTRRIMIALFVWVLTAAVITAGILFYATLAQAKIILLLATALIVWRIAIATSHLRMAERAAQRKIDEESLCTEIVIGAWEDNTESRKPRLEIEFDPTGRPLSTEAK